MKQETDINTVIYIFKNQDRTREKCAKATAVVPTICRGCSGVGRSYYGTE